MSGRQRKNGLLRVGKAYGRGSTKFPEETRAGEEGREERQAREVAEAAGKKSQEHRGARGSSKGATA